MTSTLSIRRVSTRSMHTISLQSPDSSDNEHPPVPTLSAFGLRLPPKNFTEDQQNSRAIIEGTTIITTECPTLPSPATVRLSKPARFPVRRLPSMRLETSQNAGQPLRRIVINFDERVPDVPKFLEGSVTPDPSVQSADFHGTPPQGKHSNWAKRPSTSSELTYMTPISQKITSSRRPSYLLSPSRSHQQSMESTPCTLTPTWEDMYRREGLQFDARHEIPPIPSCGDSLNHRPTSTRTQPILSSVPSITTRSSPSPPPGLTEFRQITEGPPPTNTLPMGRTRMIRGPRPLVTKSRPWNGD